MKTLKRVISALMAFVLLCTMLPVQAFAAEEKAVAELRFYSDCTIDAYTVVSVGKDHKLTFNLGKNPYKFAAKFDNPDEIGHVFVSSTVEGKTKKLKAEYNKKTGLFETEGYFDPENKYYEPCNVRVEYAPKASAPAVGSEVDWNALMEHMGVDLKDAVVTNVNEGESSDGKVEFAGELADVALDYAIDTLDATELEMLRDYYGTQSGLAAYIVPGLDDTKYYAYLDMTDKETYRMFLDDGLDIGSKAVELKMSFLDKSSGEYLKLLDVSHELSNAGTVVDVIGEVYSIHKDMDALRDEVDAMEFANEETKKPVTDAIDALEEDQIAFTLLATMLPIMAVGGVAAAPAAALFTGMVKVMEAAAGLVYDYRIGTIKDKKTEAQWNSNEAGGNVEGIHWFYDKTSCILTLSGSGEIPSRLWQYVCWPVYHKDGKLASIGYAYYNTKSIRIEKGIQSIAASAFLNFNKVEETYLPNSLRKIVGTIPGDSVYFDGTVYEWEQIEGYEIADAYSPKGYDGGRAVQIKQHSGYLGENLSWYFNEHTGILTIFGDGEMADVDYGHTMVPWRRNVQQIQHVSIGSGVTRVRRKSFQGYPALESVTLPDTLEEIDSDAFMNCDKLLEITIPESVTYMSGAFSGCDSLKTAVIKGSMTFLTGFDCCTALESVHILGNMDFIGSSAFKDCTALKEVIIAGTIGYISDNAFDGCKNLTDIDLPEGITGILKEAFLDCASLKDIQFSESLTKLEESAFQNCTSLTAVRIPASVTEIGGYAFAGCTGITQLELLSTADIPKGVFSGCTGLTQVTVPVGTQNIGGAFAYCTGLKQITLPDTLREKFGLATCTALEDVYFGSNETTWNNFSSPLPDSVTMHYESDGLCGENMRWDFEEDTGKLTIFGSGYMDDYHQEDGPVPPWKEYGDKVKTLVLTEGISSVGNDGFKNMTGITGEVVFPMGLKVIGARSFMNCDGITGITILDKNTDLWKSAFEDCDQLVDISLPENHKGIGGVIFAECDSLAQISIPSGLGVIGADAFRNCASLKRIDFLGDAPGEIANSWSGKAFAGIKADVYYPADNPTWTEDKFQNYGGHLVWHASTGGEDQEEIAYNEQYLQKQIDEGKKNISVDSLIRLENDFTIPKDILADLGNASTLIIPAGKTLTVQAGKLSAWQGGAWGESKIIVEKGGTLEVITDESNNGDLGVLNPGNYLIVEEGGLLKVNGTVSAHYGATIDMQGSYEIGTDKNGKPWHVKIGYADTEKGYVPSVIKGIPLKDQMLVWNVTTTQQWEELVEVLNEDAYGSYDIRIQTPVILDQELIVPKLCSISGINDTNYMEITESGILRSFGEVITYSDNALKNNGTIEIYNRLYIAGAMPNSGTIHVNAGGLLDIRNDGYVTNTGTVHINESGKVEVGREGTFQNDGEVYVNAGGSLEIVNTDWAQGTWLGKEAVINGGSTGHTHSYSQYVYAPTCTELGYTVHSCSCGDAYATDYVDALGHDYDEGKVTHEPTESDEGIKTFICQTCGETKTESIPKLDHVHNYEQKVTAPTCTEQGYTTHTCACGDNYVDAYTDPSGHSWDEGKVTTQPGCNSKGVKTFTCSRDASHTYTESIPAVGHSFGDWYVTKEATTEECGEERRDCANCGEAETRVTEKLPTEPPQDTGMSEAEKALRQSIANGFTDIAVTESITLSQDLHIPENVNLVIENGATLSVPDGVALKSDGQMFIFENSALKTKGGTLEFGNQDWAAIDVWGGTLDVSEGTLQGLQQNSVRVLLGSTSSVKGIENHMLYGDYLVDSMARLATALSQADQYGYMQMDVMDSFDLKESIVIPENALLSIYENETELTIPKGVTVINKGQVWGMNASTLIVMNGAEFHNEGYLYMEEGSALLHFGGYQDGGQTEGPVFYGVISQNEMEELLSEDSDQIIYLFETTLEQDMEISIPFALYHCGRIVIPNGVTLTINGPLSLMAGSQIIVESGGRLVLNGDVSNAGAVLVSDSGALEANGSWEGNQPLSDHTHTYSETVTKPTCAEQGYTTYVCECGDSYVGNYVAAQGHSIGGWNSDEMQHWHMCSACGEKLDAAGHDGAVCSVCGYKTPGEDSHEFSLGDVNHDGKINAKDATLILQKSVGVLKETAKFCEDCAEVSGDGKLNAKDSTLILQFSVGLRETFPAEQ